MSALDVEEVPLGGPDPSRHDAAPPKDGPVDDDQFSVDDSQDFGFMTDEEEQGISINLPSKSYTKLEVIQAHEISVILLMLNIAIFVSVFSVVLLVVLGNTAWAGASGLSKFDTHYQRFEAIWSLIVEVYLVVVLVIYTARIGRLQPRQRTHEQIWVCVMLTALIFYNVPFDPIDTLLNFAGKPIRVTWQRILDGLFLGFKTAGFNTATIFFVWSSVHSYRVFKGPLPLVFYVPKLLIVGMYTVWQLILSRANGLIVSELPFITFFGMLRIYGSDGFAGNDRTVLDTVLYTLFELFIVAWVFRDIVVTKTFLRNSDYMRFRYKQIGFLFFLYHNLTFYGVFWLMAVLLTVCLPHTQPGSETFFRSALFPFGMLALLATYATAEVFVKLPADSVGFRGLFVPQPPSQRVADETEPITYRKREPQSFSGVVDDLKSNVFVMQTQVIMFNFAWLVYYYGTKKIETFKPKQDVFRFKIAAFVSEPATDTHALVTDGEDRIIVSFRGTTSMQNLRTDLKIKQTRADTVLPSRKEYEWNSVGGKDYSSVWSDPTFQKGRLHKGFVEAYCSVSERILETVKALYLEKKRPIFLTGHSLGGCLATLCSADLMMSLGLGPREVYVSTFGSPRVANRAFRDVYNDLVPIHWRILVGPDMIPKLPKVGYKHVGKKVLLTANGSLFIDPNALELKLWHGEAASVLYHRKASYMLAIKAWCELHHGDTYLPEFWPWPVSDDDSRRFEHALTLKLSSKGYDSKRVSSTKEGPQDRHKLLVRDGLVDVLGSYQPGVGGDVIGRWARLTRKLIMQEQIP